MKTTYFAVGVGVTNFGRWTKGDTVDDAVAKIKRDTAASTTLRKLKTDVVVYKVDHEEGSEVEMSNGGFILGPNDTWEKILDLDSPASIAMVKK